MSVGVKKLYLDADSTSSHCPREKHRETNIHIGAAILRTVRTTSPNPNAAAVSFAPNGCYYLREPPRVYTATRVQRYIA